MGIQKEKTYLVLNYCANPVSVVTRYDQFIMEPFADGEPSSLPLTLDEIQQANNNSKLFKTGHLRFEPEHEEEIYDVLHIRDWKDILTNKQVEDIILHPTAEKIENILKIDEPRYFNRIYGVYMGLKNAGYSISKNVDVTMSARYKELVNGKKTTNLIVSKKEDNSETKIAELEEKLAQMQQMMEKITPQEQKPDEKRAEPDSATSKDASSVTKKESAKVSSKTSKTAKTKE